MKYNNFRPGIQKDIVEYNTEKVTNKFCIQLHWIKVNKIVFIVKNLKNIPRMNCRC